MKRALEVSFTIIALAAYIGLAYAVASYVFSFTGAYDGYPMGNMMSAKLMMVMSSMLLVVMMLITTIVWIVVRSKEISMIKVYYMLFIYIPKKEISKWMNKIYFE